MAPAQDEAPSLKGEQLEPRHALDPKSDARVGTLIGRNNSAMH
jgi:hypothetical protein